MSPAHSTSSRPAALSCIQTKQSTAPRNHKAIKHLIWYRIQQEYWSKSRSVPLGLFQACGSVFLSLTFSDVCADGWRDCLSVHQHIKLDFPFPFLFHSKMLFIFMLILEKKNCSLEHVRKYLQKINDSGHQKCSILHANIL